MTNPPRVGTELAGYRIEELIERGGMSVVYLAEHVRLGRRIALKVLAPELAEDDRFRERFIRESRLAASLNHPNIVPIFDAGEAEGLLYIAMHHVEGADLKTLIRRERVLGEQRTLSILGQVAAALDVAHRKGLIHRDVKPANILIAEREDDYEHAFLSDFGLTKRSESQSGFTLTGQFVGTIDYVAPEQIEGGAVDGRADVYSLGCVLYECLTGAVPFNKDNEVAVLWSHLRDPVPKVTLLRPDLPPALADVLSKAMAKDPVDRFNTCRELIAAASEAVTTGPITLDEPARHPVEMVMSTKGPPPPMPLPVPSSAAPEAPPERAPANAPSPGKGLRWRTVVAALLAFLLGLGAATVLFWFRDRHSETNPGPSGRASLSKSVYEAILLPHIPRNIRGTCHEIGPQGEEHARAECTAEGITVTYADMHSREAALGKFQSATAEVGKGAGQQCSTQNQPAWNYWYPPPNDPEETQHIETAAQSNGAGKRFVMACLQQDGSSMVIWVDPRTNLYSVAEGADISSLMSFWQQDAGPRANPESMGMP